MIDIKLIRENRELVNEKIDYVKECLNDYFYSLLNL